MSARKKLMSYCRLCHSCPLGPGLNLPLVSVLSFGGVITAYVLVPSLAVRFIFRLCRLGSRYANRFPSVNMSICGMFVSRMLRSNQISCIDNSTFTGLSSVRLLSLYDNRISSIAPGAFSTLHSLSTMWVISDVSDVSGGYLFFASILSLNLHHSLL